MNAEHAARTDWHAQFKHLKPWLDVATWGLSDESRARVVEEISGHFEDAIEAGMRRGLSQEEAARLAVTELGSARRAQIAFRSTYLTRLQANTLHHLVEVPRRSAPIYGIVAAFLGAHVLFDPVLDTIGQAIRVGFIGLIVVAGLARTVAVPRLFRRGFRRVAVALGGAAEFAVWSTLAAAGPGSIERDVWVVCTLLLFIGFFYVPLALKVARPAAEPDDPEAAASSS